MSTADVFFWAPIVSSLIAASVVGGLLAGLFGVGGGAIFVPVLYHSFVLAGVDPSIAMHLSIGSSLAIIIPTAIRSLIAHRRHGAVNEALLREWIVAVPLGVVAGTAVAAAVTDGGLKIIFATIAFLLSLRMIVGRLPFTLGSDLPGLAGRSVAGFLIGVLSALMGIGGGVLNNTFMTAYGRTMHQAVATSSGVGVLIALPGLVSYAVAGWGDPRLPAFSLGYVSLAALLVVAPISMLVAPLGVSVAHRLSKRQLEIGFGIFLMIVALQFAASLL